jgi:hypothetical protein
LVRDELGQVCAMATWREEARVQANNSKTVLFISTSLTGAAKHAELSHTAAMVTRAENSSNSEGSVFKSGCCGRHLKEPDRVQQRKAVCYRRIKPTLSKGLSYQQQVVSGETLRNRHAHRLKPPADVNLSVSFSAKMPGIWGTGCFEVPLDHDQLVVTALNHQPTNRITGDNATDFALELLEGSHFDRSVT